MGLLSRAKAVRHHAHGSSIAAYVPHAASLAAYLSRVSNALKPLEGPLTVAQHTLLQCPYSVRTFVGGNSVPKVSNVTFTDYDLDATDIAGPLEWAPPSDISEPWRSS